MKSNLIAMCWHERILVGARVLDQGRHPRHLAYPARVHLDVEEGGEVGRGTKAPCPKPLSVSTLTAFQFLPIDFGIVTDDVVRPGHLPINKI